MKNNYKICGDTTIIYVESPKYGNKEILIDTEDIELVKNNKWCVIYRPTINDFYASTCVTIAYKKQKQLPIHRLIMSDCKNKDVDHINHSGLDNRKSNLRIASRAENAQNRKGADRTSLTGVRNVTWHNKSYEVNLVIKGKRHYFGTYKDINEAEKVAIEARRKHMAFSQESLAS